MGEPSSKMVNEIHYIRFLAPINLIASIFYSYNHNVKRDSVTLFFRVSMSMSMDFYSNAEVCLQMV